MAKTIQQLAEEYRRKIRPLFESYSESNLYPVSAYDQDDMDKMFEYGVNYTLDEIRRLMEISQIHSYHEVYDDIVKLMKQLKGE